MYLLIKYIKAPWKVGLLGQYDTDTQEIKGYSDKPNIIQVIMSVFITEAFCENSSFLGLNTLAWERFKDSGVRYINS